MALTHDVVGSNPTTPVSISKIFQKTKKTYSEGECLSAIVRMGIIYVYGKEARVQTVV